MSDKSFVLDRPCIGRICHVGPSEECKGGIRTVMEGITESDLSSIFDMVIISTASRTKRISTFIRGYLRCWRLIKSNNVDVFHIHMSENASCYRAMAIISLAKRYNKKVLVHSHGSKIKPFLDNMSEFTKRRFVEALTSADRVVVLTQGWKSYWSHLISPEAIEVIPNFITIPQITRESINDPIRILFMSHIADYKGIYDLIEAMIELKDRKKISNFRFVIAGDGEVDKCRKEINCAGLSPYVDVKGWVDGVQKDELLKSSDILIQPSHYESFGIVLIEAFSYKMPVICSDAGYMTDIVSDGVDGFVFASSDSHELATTLEKCLGEKSRLLQMGMYGYRKACADYSTTSVMNQWGKLYSDVIGVTSSVG